jgi:hypothetical protein
LKNFRQETSLILTRAESLASLQNRLRSWSLNFQAIKEDNYPRPGTAPSTHIKTLGMITSSTWLSSTRRSLQNANSAGKYIGLRSASAQYSRPNPLLRGYQTTISRARASDSRQRKAADGKKVYTGLLH